MNIHCNNRIPIGAETNNLPTPGSGTIATTTYLVSSVNPAVIDQLITFTATVIPNSGAHSPTGPVWFYDGPTLIGIGYCS